MLLVHYVLPHSPSALMPAGAQSYPIRETLLQGTSRYEVMLQPMKPLRYSHLRSCGHTAFTGPPLAAALEVVGSPMVDLWVASSDPDADVFAYLEDVDPVSGKAR